MLNGKDEKEGLPLSFRETVSLPPNFPDPRIIAAFAEPLNDPCPTCTWGAPDLPSLRGFAAEKVDCCNECYEHAFLFLLSSFLNCFPFFPLLFFA